MIQLFIIIAFLLGILLGYKLSSLAIAYGLVTLAQQKNSGVIIKEDGNIHINCDLLQKK